MSFLHLLTDQTGTNDEQRTTLPAQKENNLQKVSSDEMTFDFTGTKKVVVPHGQFDRAIALRIYLIHEVPCPGQPSEFRMYRACTLEAHGRGAADIHEVPVYQSCIRDLPKKSFVFRMVLNPADNSNTLTEVANPLCPLRLDDSEEERPQPVFMRHEHSELARSMVHMILEGLDYDDDLGDGVSMDWRRVDA